MSDVAWISMFLTVCVIAVCTAKVAIEWRWSEQDHTRPTSVPVWKSEWREKSTAPEDYNLTPRQERFKAAWLDAASRDDALSRDILKDLEADAMRDDELYRVWLGMRKKEESNKPI